MPKPKGEIAESIAGWNSPYIREEEEWPWVSYKWGQEICKKGKMPFKIELFKMLALSGEAYLVDSAHFRRPAPSVLRDEIKAMWVAASRMALSPQKNKIKSETLPPAIID